MPRKLHHTQTEQINDGKDVAAADDDTAKPQNTWPLSLAVTRWCRSTQLLYIEPG